MQVIYEDKVASGETVVVGAFTKAQRDMVRVTIGNFPPLSKAELKCYFYQKLDQEDISHCLRFPVTYVPRYMGDVNKYINTGAAYKGQ